MSQLTGQKSQLENDERADNRRPSPVVRPDQVTCPFCHESDVELFSLFGSQLLTTQYYCKNCLTVFESLK